MSTTAIIAAKEAELAQLKDVHNFYMEKYGYLIAQCEQDIYELNIRLQIEAEEEEGWRPRHDESSIKEEAEEDPCYDCGRTTQSCICARSSLSPTAEIFYPTRSVRTKLKWVSVSDPETYRVAIVKSDGILEVKRVTEGGGYCHDTTTCDCVPCAEIRLSERLGVPRPPWLARNPLRKTFFETEAAWRDTLPEGVVTITDPPISNRALRLLSTKPLENATDALRLKELEERFPGATMILTTHTGQYEVAYEPDPVNDNIYSEKAQICAPSFSDFGVRGKPNLMAEWRGLYIDLSHLF
jgi:hypothetical protein